MELGSIIQSEPCYEKQVGPCSLTMVETLQQTEVALASKLNDVQLALKALREHPEIAETLELVRKVSHY